MMTPPILSLDTVTRLRECVENVRILDPDPRIAVEQVATSLVVLTELFTQHLSEYLDEHNHPSSR